MEGHGGEKSRQVRKARANLGPINSVNLVTLTFDPTIGIQLTRDMGNLHANFGLSIVFALVLTAGSGQTDDRQTDDAVQKS